MYHTLSNKTATRTVWYAAKYALKYTPGCTRLYTPSLLDLCAHPSSQDAPKYSGSTLPSTAPSSFSSILPGTLPSTLPLALDRTQPASLTVNSQTGSQEALNHTPEHALQYTSNCTQWLTLTQVDHPLPSMLPKCSHVHRVWSQVHSRACSYWHSHLHLMAASPLDCTLPN